VIAGFDTREVAPQPTRFGLLTRLVVALGPTGDWAMRRCSVGVLTGIHIAYEKAEDAAKLSEEVGAVAAVTARYSLWASQAEFWLDRSASQSITVRLEDNACQQERAIRNGKDEVPISP